MNDSEIDDQVETGVRKPEVRDIAFEESGIWQRARFGPGSSYHPRIQVDPDVFLRRKQVADYPGSRSLAAADFENLFGR